MALDLRPPNGSNPIFKVQGTAATTLRTITAKLTLIFGGRRVTLSETIDILTSALDDSALDQLARNYAQRHGIDLPAGRS
jgi:hypothetical protein